MIGFLLPSGKSQVCWVSRRNWLTLIYQLSSPDDLPVRARENRREMIGNASVSAPSAGESIGALDSPEQASVRDEKGRDEPMEEAHLRPMKVVNRVTVVKTQTGLCISFVLDDVDGARSGDVKEKINLNISAQELRVLLAALNLKARQADWDADVALERFRENQKKRKLPPKSAMH